MTITVVMTTWDDGTGIRARYAQQTIPSLLDHLKCTTHQLKLHIADDGSEHCTELYMPLMDLAKDKWGQSAMSSPKHNGIGSSLNYALHEIDDIWMYTTDDWLLLDDLNLDMAVKILNLEHDYVRIGPVHPNLECVTRFQQGIGWWLELMNTSGFAFATRPFIATKRFYNKIGPFLEGANSYVVEQDYALRCSRNRYVLNMAATMLHGPWEHIGDYNVGEKNV